MVKRTIIMGVLGLSLTVCGALSLSWSNDNVQPSKHNLAEHGSVPLSQKNLLAEHGSVPLSQTYLSLEHGSVPT